MLGGFFVIWFVGICDCVCAAVKHAIVNDDSRKKHGAALILSLARARASDSQGG